MSISLKQLASKVKSCEESFAKKIALFGPPGSGKTQIAATIARVSSIKKVHWFDLENGVETLIYARDSNGQPLLTEEEQDKITVYRISDTADSPRAAETFLKAFTSHQGVKLCQEHGAVDCKHCGASSLLPFNLFSLGEDEAVVIDSGSQLADSVLNLSQLQNSYKDLRKYYGDVTIDLGAIMAGIQAARCNIVMCTHELTITKTVEVAQGKTEERTVRVVPLCGSRNFSDKVGKYFGYKIYTYNNGSTFRATVATGKIPHVLVSSRRPVTFEGSTNPSLEALFAEEVAEPIPDTDTTVASNAKPTSGIKKPGISIKR